MHFENLIVKGVYPVIKDIETIFASYLFLYIQKPEYDAQYNATKKLMYGTMATGLVPVFDMSIECGKDIIQGFNDANEIFRKASIYIMHSLRNALVGHFVMPQVTNITVPKGGVIVPTDMLNTTIMPN